MQSGVGDEEELKTRVTRLSSISDVDFPDLEILEDDEDSITLEAIQECQSVKSEDIERKSQKETGNNGLDDQPFETDFSTEFAAMFEPSQECSNLETVDKFDSTILELADENYQDTTEKEANIEDLGTSTVDISNLFDTAMHLADRHDTRPADMGTINIAGFFDSVVLGLSGDERTGTPLSDLLENFHCTKDLNRRGVWWA